MKDARPLSVLHLTAGSDAGGVSRYLYDLCRAMHRRGHRVALAGQRGAWHDLFEQAPWPWVEVPLKGGPAALWRSARRIEAYLREHPADVIHCHYRRPSLVARRLQRRLGVPVLFTLHLTDIAVGGLARRLSDFGDITHVASAEAQRWLIEEARVSAQRIVVIPHGVDPARYPKADETRRAAARRALGLPEQALVAAYVGRFDVPKNEEWMLDLAQRSAAALPELHVVMLGEGPHEQELHRQVAARGLGARVMILPTADPLPVYQGCDALLLPSTREGFSLVCAEAMSVGRAVLRTRTAGTAEMINEGVTGRSTPIEREAFLASALSMLGDRAALASMGHAAAEHARRRLSFEGQVERTIALYRRMRAGLAPMDAT